MRHQSTVATIVFLLSLGFIFLVSDQGQVRAEENQMPAKEMAEEGIAPDFGELQERAVPRMKLRGRAASKVKGFVVQGNRIKTKPGYVFKKGPKNQVSVMRAINGAGGLTVTCKCMDGNGECAISTSDDVAVCSKNPGNVCNGSCAWDLNGPKTLAPSGRSFSR